MGGENIFGEGLPIDGASETEGMGWRRGSDKGFVQVNNSMPNLQGGPKKPHNDKLIVGLL